MSQGKEYIEMRMREIQDSICEEVEREDPSGVFIEDQWERKEGGGGRTRVIRGEKIEKGGVNFSAVHGPTPEKILRALQLPEADFFATGVSIVLHPVNPNVPIIHMNIRYFEMSNGTYWFGGGIDLTPHWVDMEEARSFHRQLREICDSHNDTFYPRFKQWADQYFYLPHRGENRGVGGIFFDRLSEASEGMDKKSLMDFTFDVGEHFCEIYLPILRKQSRQPYRDNDLEWQALRRGRYVEFNLVWDKGTRFGLDTGGRTESILMSMPPRAQWEYCHEVAPGSREEETLEILRKGAFPLE